jgi:hypothetical protein
MQIHIYRYRTPRWLRALTGLGAAVLIALVVLLVLVLTGIGHAQALPGARLTWDAATTGGAPDTYVIERRIGPTGAWVAIGTVAATVRTYTDSTLQPGTTYFYQVLAQNIAGVSAPSNMVSLSVPTAPQMPVNLRGTIVP